MGAGLHGLNGLSPAVAYKIYYMYVVPRLLSGLEATIVTTHEMVELERFHRFSLRCLQHLPERTPIPAIYCLIGALPIEGQLDMRYLTLFGSIVRRSGSKIYKLAKRQLIMKDPSSYSWFSKITILLYKYGLMSPLDLFVLAPGKEAWKKIVKSAVFSFWRDRLLAVAEEKKSLRFSNLGAYFGKAHHVWDSAVKNQRDTRRATIKAKLLTGTYMLQGNRAVWDAGKHKRADPTCPLCHTEAEDRLHFIIRCPVLDGCRISFVAKLFATMESHNLDISPFCISEELLFQLVMDCTHPSVLDVLQLDVVHDIEVVHEIESHSRIMCHALHYRRAQLLGYNP